MDRTVLAVEDGVLLEAPVFKRGREHKSFAAVIWEDRGRVGRKFLDRVHDGPGIYRLNGMQQWDAIEFGHVETDSLGQAVPVRWHGVVLTRADDVLVLERHRSPMDAIVASRKLRQAISDVAPGAAPTDGQLRNEMDRIESERARLMTEWYALGVRLQEIQRTLGVKPPKVDVVATLGQPARTAPAPAPAPKAVSVVRRDPPKPSRSVERKDDGIFRLDPNAFSIVKK